jgi:Ser/Thr protein kinase RdoA (MazF antagonist)
VFVDGDLSATCWHRLVDNGQPIDWREVGAIVRQVHGLEQADLPDDYPLPPPTAFPWWDFETLMADVGDEIDDLARAGLARAIERNADWRLLEGVNVVCHGDVHPGNVVMTADGPILMDWDLMCMAPAGWDHAMLLTLAERWGGEPQVYPQFAEGYGASLADDVTARRFAELRNVAATLMRVRAGRTDAHARHEAQRRLRYWRGDADAPSWQAQ